MDVHPATDATTSPQPADAALQPVRTHEDVLHVIADVQKQLDRLRLAEARGAEANAQFEERWRRLEEREANLHSGEALLVAREAQLRAIAESVHDERVRSNERATELEAREATLAARESALDSERTALDAARSSLSSDRRILEELREELARREDQSRQECDRLRASLEEARLDATRLRERWADAEASLASRDASFEAKAGEIETLRADLELMRSELAQSKEANEVAVRTAAIHAAEAAKTAESALVAADYEGKMEALRAELAASVREREHLAVQLSEAHAAGEAVAHGVAESALAVQAKAERERQSLEAEFEAKRQALASIGVFLRNRKIRLDRARALCRARVEQAETKAREASEGALVRVLEEERLLKKEREDLRQVQEVLTATEQSILNRDSRHRTVKTMAVCSLIAGALAVGSWFAAGIAFPAPAVVSVDLVAKPHDGGTLTPEAALAFDTGYKQALEDEAFRGVVQKRLAERGVASLGSPSDTAKWMDSIRTDSDGPGSLRLVAEGPDTPTATIALDTVATSLVNEAPKLAKARPNLPRIALAGQANQPGRLTFSTPVPQTSSNDRVMVAAMIFSGVLALGGVLGFFLFGRLAKSKRSYEESEPA